MNHFRTHLRPSSDNNPFTIVALIHFSQSRPQIVTPRVPVFDGIHAHAYEDSSPLTFFTSNTASVPGASVIDLQSCFKPLHFEWKIFHAAKKAFLITLTASERTDFHLNP